MVGCEVEQRADGRLEVWSIVELERGELEREPVGRIRRARDVGERPADVSRGLRAQAAGDEQVRGQRGGGGLAIGAGDPDAAGAAEREKSQIGFGVDLESRPACRLQRGDIRWHPGRYDHGGGASDPL
jgi:hypothetical protein